MERYHNLARADLVRLLEKAEASHAASAGDEALQLVQDLQRDIDEVFNA